jgi:hypothetical protein
MYFQGGINAFSHRGVRLYVTKISHLQTKTLILLLNYLKVITFIVCQDKVVPVLN